MSWVSVFRLGKKGGRKIEKQVSETSVRKFYENAKIEDGWNKKRSTPGMNNLQRILPVKASDVQNVQTRGKQECVCQMGFEETLRMIILRPITTSHLTNPIRQDHHRIHDTYRGLKAMS